MNTAQYIVKKLEELGVNEFFGLPEDFNLNLIYAVENNPNTNWVGCTNTLNAGYAADGYARIRGYGALITAYGAGELSALNAIAGCMAENVPVFHVVGLPSTEKIDGKNLIRHNFQEVDYGNYINGYKNVTAASAFLTRDNAKLEIDRLFTTMINEKKPVYAAIPEDIAQMEISDRSVSYERMSDRAVLDEVAAKIAEKIKNAQKPVIIGDILVKRFDAQIEFKEFAEKSGIPVSNFLMGTNLINMDSPNYIGVHFGKLKNPVTQKYIEETDCLIAVGAVCSDINTFGTDLPFDIKSHIAIYGNYTYVEGTRYDNIKMSELLDAVNNLVEHKNVEFNKPNIGLKPLETMEDKLTLSYLCSRLQDFIKENDIIFAETGTSLPEIAQIKFPESAEFNSQALWCSSGWATAAAFGAGLAKPQSRMILITGEGSHQQTAMEIGSMLRYGVKPVIVVINNHGYSTDRLFSDNLSGGFNDVMQMNYAKFARCFEGDIWATKVNTAEDFDKALRVTQIMNKLCYIEACIDSLDTSSLTRELIKTLKSKIHDVKIPETNINNIYRSIEEVTLSVPESDSEYQTVVHKAFDENLSEETE